MFSFFRPENFRPGGFFVNRVFIVCYFLKLLRNLMVKKTQKKECGLEIRNYDISNIRVKKKHPVRQLPFGIPRETLARKF